MKIFSVVRDKLCKVPIINEIAKTPILRIGMGLGGFAFGLSQAYYTYGKTYGQGTAFMYAAVSAHPLAGLALLGIESAKAIGDYAYQTQRLKRKSSFTTGISDNYGTINKMRMFSIQQLNKDHSTSRRVLGNEATFFANRR